MNQYKVWANCNEHEYNKLLKLDKCFNMDLDSTLEELEVPLYSLMSKRLGVLVSHVSNRLEAVRYEIMKDGGDCDIERFLSFSPAGDDMGIDNSFISFCGMDISQVVDLMGMLETLSNEDVDF